MPVWRIIFPSYNIFSASTGELSIWLDQRPLQPVSLPTNVSGSVGLITYDLDRPLGNGAHYRNLTVTGLQAPQTWTPLPPLPVPWTVSDNATAASACLRYNTYALECLDYMGVASPIARAHNGDLVTTSAGEGNNILHSTDQGQHWTNIPGTGCCAGTASSTAFIRSSPSRGRLETPERR